MGNWNNKIQVKKGDIGEEIIDTFLTEQGYYLFAPIINGAHLFDRYAFNLEKNKHFYFDVKTKARLNNWEAQGVDEKHYLKYLEASEKLNIPFYIFFIDENNGEIHSADIKNIKDKIFYIPMKKTNKDKIVAWNLKDMKYIGKINDLKVLNKLKNYNSRAYKISQIQTIPFNYE
jgi:hypothetical protein